MSYSVSGSTINLTRADTFRANVYILRPDGTQYFPHEGDKVRFAMKYNVNDEEPVLVIDIPVDTMELVITPEQTKELEFNTRYVYDIELTTSEGIVDTFITSATLNLTEEVY